MTLEAQLLVHHSQRLRVTPVVGEPLSIEIEFDVALECDQLSTKKSLIAIFL